MRATLTLAALCLLLPLTLGATPAVRAVHRWAYWHTPACSLGLCVNVWDRRVDVYRDGALMPPTPPDDMPP